MKKQYILTSEEEKVVRDYLNGKIRYTRPVAEALHISRQQVLNMLSGICRQWIQEGKLQFVKE